MILSRGKIKLLRTSETRLNLEGSSSIQPAKIHTRTESTHDQLHVVCALAILAAFVVLNAGLDHSGSDLVFRQPRLRNNFIFGMLYQYMSRYSTYLLQNLVAAYCNVRTATFILTFEG